MAQHFVPQFYLKHFTPNLKGRIHAYQRDADALVGTVRDFCCERGFYSFVDAEGEVNTTFDDMLQQLETIWADAFRKLRKAKDPDVLTDEEHYEIALFLAFQQVRSRRFREHLKRFYDASGKMILRFHARDQEVLKRTFDEAQIDVSEIGIDGIQEFIMNDEYTLEYPEVYWLVESMELALELVPAYTTKACWQYACLTAPQVLITSDNPIAILRPPNLPQFWGVGIANGVICLPLSPDAALILHDNEELVDQTKVLSEQQVNTINNNLMFYAHRYVFSDHYLPEVDRDFKKTEASAGERVVIDGPQDTIPEEYRKPEPS